MAVEEVRLVDLRVGRRAPGVRGRCRRRAAPGRTSRWPRRPPSRCCRRRRAPACPRAAPGPCGTVPSRIQPIRASSISTTITRSTRWSARTRWVVKPSPRPPTTTSRGSSTSSERRRCELDLGAGLAGVHHEHAVDPQLQHVGRALLARRRSTTSPALGRGARHLGVLGHGRGLLPPGSGCTDARAPPTAGPRRLVPGRRRTGRPGQPARMTLPGKCSSTHRDPHDGRESTGLVEALYHAPIGFGLILARATSRPGSITRPRRSTLGAAARRGPQSQAGVLAQPLLAVRDHPRWRGPTCGQDDGSASGVTASPCAPDR